MKMMIGLDIGTSAVKGVLMNQQGHILKTINKKHNYYFENNIKLLNADEFADGCIEVIKELAKEVNGDVEAVCASGASGNLMLQGNTNSPIYGWQNSFDKEIVDKYIGNYSKEDIWEICGWPKQYGFPLGALAYISETDPESIKNADKICMSIEYLNYKLTGKWGITPSMGTPFFLIDQEKGEYVEEFLDIFGIKKTQLPDIMPNCSVLGTLTKEALEITGLKETTKVVLGTFDHPAAARGAAVFDDSEVLISCGTSWVVFMPFKTRKEPIEKRMLTDPFMSPYGYWCGMKSLSSIAEKIENAKKKYFGEISYSEFDPLVAKAGSDYAIVDLDDLKEIPDNTDKTLIARGIAVAAAKKLNELLEIAGVTAKQMKVVGGITNSKEWLQVMEEITGKKVTVINGECAGAAGSAVMAGVGVKIFSSERDLF